MNYFIAVETPIAGDTADLAGALRVAYDNGAAGDFQILVTFKSTFMVVFQRDAHDDAEYVSKHMVERNSSAERAAMSQLAAELKEGGVGDVAMPLVAILNHGEAQVFDFCSGAVEYMASYEVEEVPKLPKSVRDVLSQLVAYAENATLEGDALPECVNTANLWLEEQALEVEPILSTSEALNSAS